MVLYVAMAIFYMCLIPLDKIIQKRINRTIWSNILFAPLFFMTAFRDNTVGSDTSAYEGLYRIFSQQPLFEGPHYNIEIGYVFVNRLFGILGIDYFLFQIIYALFIYLTLSMFVSKYSKNISFSVFFFITFRFFFFSMTGMRQMIAIALLLRAVPLIEKRQVYKFFVLVIIASLIHTTAIIFVILYFIPISNLRPKSILKISFMCVPVFIGAEFCINTFTSIFPKYDTYLNRMDTYDGIFVYIQMLVILVFLLSGILGKQNEQTNLNIYIRESYEESSNAKKLVSVDKIVLNAIIIAYIFSVLAMTINIAGRIGRYFTMFLLLYLPNNIENVKNNWLKVNLYYVITIGLLMYHVVVLQMRPGWDGIIPFRWIWMK